MTSIRFKRCIQLCFLNNDESKYFVFQGRPNSHDKPHFFGEQWNFLNDDESLDPDDYVLRSCSVVLNVLENAMSEEESCKSYFFLFIVSIILFSGITWSFQSFFYLQRFRPPRVPRKFRFRMNFNFRGNSIYEAFQFSRNF